MADDQSSTLIEWRPIPGYPGYRVSNTGRVQTAWERVFGVLGFQYKIGSTWRDLSQRLVCNYYTVTLNRSSKGYTNGKGYTHCVHILILTAFVSPRPPGLIACHGLAGSKVNHIANLRWDTYKSNTADAIRAGTHPRGEKAGRAKLTEEIVREIRNHGAKQRGDVRDMANRFGVTSTLIGKILRREIWKDIVTAS